MKFTPAAAPKSADCWVKIQEMRGTLFLRVVPRVEDAPETEIHARSRTLLASRRFLSALIPLMLAASKTLGSQKQARQKVLHWQALRLCARIRAAVL